MAASCKMSGLARYAALKGLSVRHVRRLCEAGKIPANRKENRWQIDPRWLQALIEARSIFGTPRELEFTLAAKGIVRAVVFTAVVIVVGIWAAMRFSAMIDTFVR